MAISNITNNINKLNGNLHTYTGAGKTRSKNPPSRPNMPPDRVTLSKAALAKNGQKPNTAGIISNPDELSTEEKQVVNDLKSRDAEVKSHEAAHMAAGGGIVQGGASYEYQTGPDGKMYAVGGEVQIDVSPEGTPEGTIRKMQQIRAAAMAPSQPSATDRAVAAQAYQIEARARMEETQKDRASQESQGIVPPLSGSSVVVDPNADQIIPGAHIDFMA